MFGLSLPAISFATIIKIITSPVGKYIGAGLILLAAYTAGDIRGRRAESHAWKAATAEAIQKAKEQDRIAHEQAAKDDQATIAQLKTEKDQSDARIAELEDQLQSRPADPACVYGRGGKPAGGLRVPLPRPRASRPAGPTILPSAPREATGHRWF